MTGETRLSRSFQTAPAAVPGENSAKYLESGFQREGFEISDWLVPDLEDGTAPQVKEQGLENTIELVSEYAPSFNGEIWPRIQWSYDDEELQSAGEREIKTLIREAGDHLTGFVVPKVGFLDNAKAAEAVISEAEEEAGFNTGEFEMSSIIETARGRSDLKEIARYGQDSRLHGLVFGPVDYSAEVGARKTEGEWPIWDSLVQILSNEASTNDLISIGGPFDQIFREQNGITVYNADKYAENALREAIYGLDGSWSLHPKQTVQANRIHMPNKDELERDVTSLEEFLEAKSAGRGAILVDGQMVDEGTLKNLANTIRTVSSIHRRHPDQTQALYENQLLDRTLALADEF